MYNTRRNIKLLEANELSSLWHLYSPDARVWLTNRLRLIHRQYMEGYTYYDEVLGEDVKVRGVERKVIVLKNKEDGELKVMKYVTRFDKNYIIDQLIKMRKWFTYQVRDLHRNHGKFLTLTLKPDEFRSVRDGYKQGQKKLNIFLTRLRKLYPRMGYIMVKEIQELNTKNVHWHVLLVGIPDLSKEMLDDYWGLGFWKIEDVDNNYKGTKNGLMNYMKKYLEKSLKQSEMGKVSDTLLWIWAMMIRSFSFSRIPKSVKLDPARELDQSMNNSNDLDSEWEYVGTFPADLPWDVIKTYDDLIYWTKNT